jgi:hypothetical protein
MAFSNEPIPCLLPPLYTTIEGLRILISRFNELSCLTGRSRLVGSSTVKHSLLVLGYRRELRPKLVEREGSFDVEHSEFILVIVGTDKENGPGFQFLIDLFRTDTFWLCHNTPPVYDLIIRHSV